VLGVLETTMEMRIITEWDRLAHAGNALQTATD
jgi:hypothetical protein